MTGRLEWPDPTEDLTPEEERLMEDDERQARECQTCGGSGVVLVYACKGLCLCGMCPEIEDCPECVGQMTLEDAA